MFLLNRGAAQQFLKPEAEKSRERSLKHFLKTYVRIKLGGKNVQINTYWLYQYGIGASRV